MHTEGLSKVTRQGMDREGWLQREAQQKAKSSVTGWKLEIKGSEVEDGKTGRLGKAGFRNCALEMKVALQVEMHVGSSR